MRRWHAAIYMSRCESRTFDRIVANPPYMPSLRPAQLYAYGGELGDEITRRIVKDLPNFLQPGGRFYCVTVGPDRKGEGFEDRIRSWLAEAGPEFHIFLFERRVIDRDFVAYQQAARSLGGIGQVDEWKALFEKHQVEGLCYGTLVIQRRSGPGKAVTVRRRKGRRLGTAEIEWLRAWETAAADPAILSRILDSRPRAVPSLALRVTHRLQRRGTCASGVLAGDRTIRSRSDCSIQPWVAYALPRCDGKTTARELLGWLKQNELVAANEPEEEFADYPARADLGRIPRNRWLSAAAALAVTCGRGRRPLPPGGWAARPPCRFPDKKVIALDSEAFLAHELIEIVHRQKVNVGRIVPLVGKQIRSWARGR